MRLRGDAARARGPTPPGRGWGATPSTASAALLAALAAYEERRPVLDGCEYREALQAVRVEGGVAGNVVPDRAARARSTTASRPTARRRGRGARAGAAGARASRTATTVEVVDVAPAPPPGARPPAAGRAASTATASPVRAKLGWTDVARFAAHGIPAANFGPGDPTLAHTADERVDRASIERALRARWRDLLHARGRPVTGGAEPPVDRQSRRRTVTTLP